MNLTTPRKPRGNHRPRRAPDNAPCIVQLVHPAGDRREFDLPPADLDTSRRRADRLAALVGAIVDPEHARGARIVVVAVDTRAEVDARPVTVRRRKPVQPVRAAEADERARYALLRQSAANRAGWRVLDAARELLDLIERFEVEGDGNRLWAEFARAGLPPESPTPGGFGAGYFEPVAADVSGFAWSLSTFINLLASGLALRPASEGRA